MASMDDDVSETVAKLEAIQYELSDQADIESAISRRCMAAFSRDKAAIVEARHHGVALRHVLQLKYLTAVALLCPCMTGKNSATRGRGGRAQRPAEAVF